MTRAGLSLSSWRRAPPGPSYFGNDGTVLWLARGEASLWLTGLKESLRAAGRLWEPHFRIVPVSDPLPGRSPWAWRPDRELPTRWSSEGTNDEGGELAHRLADLPGCPEVLVGAVLEGLLGSLGSQSARVVCEQTAAVLAEDRPYLLFEPNGGNIVQVLRGLRRQRDPSFARPGNVRTAEELRRILELAGLGIAAASVLPPRGAMGRLGARALGSIASPWLVIEGRRI